jgi:hypothetical protein
MSSERERAAMGSPIARGRRGVAPILLAVVVVVAAVVIVVGGLYAVGTFNSTSSGSAPTSTYTVTYTETGLPSGTSWSVTLFGTPHLLTSNTATFSLADGTYPYTVDTASGFTASPSGGTVVVAGAALSVPITFTPFGVATYTATFSERGLPAGTSWSATLAGSTQTSTTTSLAFSEANGTYSYTLGAVSGYDESPSSGSVTISGASVSLTISFTNIVTYSVVFTETGLTGGTSWTVTLSGVSQSSSTSTITFSELNGSYSYSVSPVSGYTSTPSSGSVKVAGIPAGVPITFTSSSTPTIAIAYTTQLVLNVSSGKDILIVNMTSIHNSGYSSFYVNPLFFEVTTGGVSYSYDPSTFELADQLPDVTVLNNGTTSGALAFLIPSGPSGFSMNYSGFSSYNIEWVNDGTSSSVVVTVTYTTQLVPNVSPGNDILIVNMTSIHNSGYSSIYVSPGEFEVTTAGVPYSIDPSTFELADQLPAVELQNHGRTSGAVAFLIPSGSSGYTMSYSGAGYYNVNWVNDGTSSSVVVTIKTSTYTASNISYNTPSPGYEYLIVNLTVNDRGYTSFGVGPPDFTVTTGGVTYTWDVATFSLNDALQGVNLQNGETASGAVAFQVPIGSSGYTFTYSTGVSGLYYNIDWVSA